MNDGWKFAESLLGITAEALKARREAEARADAADDYVPQFSTREEAEKAMDDLSGINSVARGHEDPHEHHRRMWVLHGEKKAPPAYSVEERRVRVEVAERLWWALGPSGGQATKHDLDAMLAEVARANEDALKWRNRAVTDAKVRDIAVADTEKTLALQLCAMLYPDGPSPSLSLDAALSEVGVWVDRRRDVQIRDAALEEAIEALVKAFNYSRTGDTCSVIRALKSKPAPTFAGIGVGAAKAYQEALSQPSGNSGELDAETRDTIDSGGGFSHLSGATTQTGDVHDFGWALQQMRAGKKVRRPSWPEGEHWALTTRAGEDPYFSNRSNYEIGGNKLLATDWQVVE